MALSFTGAQEEVADEKLVVQRIRRVVHLLVPHFEDLAAPLFQLLEVQRIVDVDHENLLRAFQSREERERVSLNDDHIRPLLVFDHGTGAMVRDDSDLEGIVQGVGAGHAEQAHVMLFGQKLGDVPGTDRRAGHLLSDRVPGDDQDAAAGDRGEHVEAVDNFLVATEVGLDRVRRFVDVAEQIGQFPVRPNAGALHTFPGGTHLRQELDELVDREDAGHRGLRHGHQRITVVAGDPQIERSRVEFAAADGPAHGQQESPGEHSCQGFVVEVLVQRVQGVALEQVLLAEVAELVHRRVMLVEGQGFGLEPEPVAEKVEPPAQVDVIVEHEVVVVEPAEFFEDVGSDEHGRTRAEEHVLLLIPSPAVFFAGVRLVAHAVPGHGRVEVVDVHTVPVKNLAGDSADVGTGREGVDGFLDPVGVGLRVVVKERYKFPGGLRDAKVAPSGESEVLGGLDEDDVATEFLELGQAVVAGSVLDDHDLEQVRIPIQCLKTANALDGVVGPPKVNQYDGHETRATFTHASVLKLASGKRSQSINCGYAHRAPMLARRRRRPFECRPCGCHWTSG